MVDLPDGASVVTPDPFIVDEAQAGRLTNRAPDAARCQRTVGSECCGRAGVLVGVTGPTVSRAVLHLTSRRCRCAAGRTKQSSDTGKGTFWRRSATLPVMISARHRQARPRARKGVVLSLSAVALLSACGSASTQSRLGGESQGPALTREQYQNAIYDIRNDPEPSTSGLFSAVVGDLNKQDCSDKAHALHDALAAILRRVEALRPPAEAEDAQEAFLEAANESVRLVGVAADDVDEGTLTCGTPMNKRIYDMPSTRRAVEAIDVLVKLGYNVLGD